MFLVGNRESLRAADGLRRLQKDEMGTAAEFSWEIKSWR